MKLIKLAVSRRRSTLGLVRCLVGGDKIQGDSNRRFSLRFLALTKGSEFQRVTVANRSRIVVRAICRQSLAENARTRLFSKAGKAKEDRRFESLSAPPTSHREPLVISRSFLKGGNRVSSSYSGCDPETVLSSRFIPSGSPIEGLKAP